MRLNVRAKNGVQRQTKQTRRELTSSTIVAFRADAHRRLWTSGSILNTLGAVLAVTLSKAVILHSSVELETIRYTFVSEIVAQTEVIGIVEAWHIRWSSTSNEREMNYSLIHWVTDGRTSIGWMHSSVNDHRRMMRLLHSDQIVHVTEKFEKGVVKGSRPSDRE